MSEIQNFKEHWLDFFKDSSLYQIEIIEEDDILETIRVSSPNLMNRTTIELSIYIEDGHYQSMFCIRFFHPQHIGFNKYQRQQEEGYSDAEGEFTPENIASMETHINDYLKQGLSEKIFSYNESHFKSDIRVIENGATRTFTWHDKEHMMSNKVQRFLNRSFIDSFTVETGKWV